jgi:transcriptional regulator with XRE-family HTH domain
MKITGAQIRAARAFLNWTVADLVKAAGVSPSTVQKVEDVDGEPLASPERQWRAIKRDESLTKMRGALEKAGITFLPDTAQGVGLRGRLSRD